MKTSVIRVSVFTGMVMTAAFLLLALGGIVAPTGLRAAACSPTTPGYAQASANVTVPTSGTYTIWSRIKAPTAANNSYWLEVDGNCLLVGDLATTPNTWNWVNYQNNGAATRLTLAAGSHSVRLLEREAGVQVDRLIFASNPACIPTGVGDNCLPQAAPQPGGGGQPNSNVTVPFRMNVGGGQYIDKYGVGWVADSFYNGGQTDNQGAGKTIAGSEGDNGMYQDERWGMTGYSIPIANGTYTLALHFAEIYQPCSAVGCRVFSVTAEDKTVLANFDIIKAAGGQFKANVQLFTVTVTDGKLDVGFQAKTNAPALAALQVLSSSAGPSPSPSSGSASFSNKILIRPNNAALYARNGKASSISNGAIQNCITVRRATGPAIRVDDAVANLYGGGTEGYCYYEQEPGLNFVREDGTNPVWLVQSGGTKLHVGVLCVPDPYTTQLKKFRVFVVPLGETAGHRQTGDFIGSPSKCGSMPG